MSYVGISPKAEKIQSFKDLKIWQEGHTLVVMIYNCTKTFPSSEQFGLSNQLRRAAVSITSNIAEGFRKNSAKEKRQFYSTASGSLSEIENQLLIAKDVGFLSVEEYSPIQNQIMGVGKLLTGLIRSAISRF